MIALANEAKRTFDQAASAIQTVDDGGFIEAAVAAEAVDCLRHVFIVTAGTSVCCRFHTEFSLALLLAALGYAYYSLSALQKLDKFRCL